MKVAIRVDASIQVGTGHLMRCLTLADELSVQGNKCFFVCRNLSENLTKLIRKCGHKLKMLPSSSGSMPIDRDKSLVEHSGWLGVPWEEDAFQTEQAILSIEPDLLVVDHYAIDARWERSFFKIVDKVMVIDDLADRAHDCTILLDQNFGRVEEDYNGLVPSDCNLLIGSCYSLLRPEFFALRAKSKERRKKPNLNRILISFGGADRENVAGQIIDALANSSVANNFAVDLILGACSPNRESISKKIKNLPFKVSVAMDVNDMAERMVHADLAFGGAGTTSWERCCLGVPTVLIALADNQKRTAHLLQQANAAVELSLNSSLTNTVCALIDRLYNNKQFLKELSDNASRIVDGKGCERVIKALEIVTTQ